MAADTGVPATPGTPFTLARNLGSPAEAGANVLKEPRRAAFGGYHTYFTDPDGHRWEICHNPGWSVSEDGTVRLTAVDPEG
ncbi:VOC family protein [Streptomyces bauhiniae]|uniref:VOC family protein n=1 Tax=Streptomyces bauhiniae TaxID=2340725 RepID=UPI00339F9A5C